MKVAFFLAAAVTCMHWPGRWLHCTRMRAPTHLYSRVDYVLQIHCSVQLTRSIPRPRTWQGRRASTHWTCVWSCGCQLGQREACMVARLYVSNTGKAPRRLSARNAQTSAADEDFSDFARRIVVARFPWFFWWSGPVVSVAGVSKRWSFLVYSLRLRCSSCRQCGS